jgi:hypothetical protein
VGSATRSPLKWVDTRHSPNTPISMVRKQQPSA